MFFEKNHVGLFKFHGEMNHKPDLKEGQYHQYTIVKHIELSGNECFYMLEDTYGRKQLMPSRYYQNYGFGPGDTITCRIDHINCSGKIFLEPLHPHYEEGGIYVFTVQLSYLEKNTIGEDRRVLELKDIFDKTAVCTIDNTKLNFQKGDEIECRVERIKKGKLYLSCIEESALPVFKTGEYYVFLIHDQKKLRNGRTYYMLKDKDNNSYLLNAEYYDHHHLEVGKEVECIVQKYSSKGYYILEPRHPFYEIGKIYEFEFERQFRTEKETLINTYEVVVKDVYDEELRFISEQKIHHSGKLKCKVTGIKKGKPLLALASE